MIIKTLLTFLFLFFITGCNERQAESLQVPLPTIEVETTIPLVAEVKQFKGGRITDGLDMKNIRLGKDETHTRLVFDSYNTQGSSNFSGHYTFTYDPKYQRIVAIIHGYRKFSALKDTKVRYYTNSIVQSVSLNPYKDDSAFKFTIQLKQDAQVNIFELKEPGRIVVDITPII